MELVSVEIISSTADILFPAFLFSLLWKSFCADPIYPTPPLGQNMTQGQFLKRSLAGLNSEFSFS